MLNLPRKVFTCMHVLFILRTVNLVDMVSALLIVAIFIVFAVPGSYALVLSIGAMEVLILFTVRSVVQGVIHAMWKCAVIRN